MNDQLRLDRLTALRNVAAMIRDVPVIKEFHSQRHFCGPHGCGTLRCWLGWYSYLVLSKPNWYADDFVCERAVDGDALSWASVHFGITLTESVDCFGIREQTGIDLVALADSLIAKYAPADSLATLKLLLDAPPKDGIVEATASVVRSVAEMQVTL